MTIAEVSYASAEETQSLNDQVASEVRATMGRFGLKQKDLSKALGISQAQVSSRLRGTTPFSLDDIEMIAKWFSTTPQVLMGFATEPKPVRPQGLEPWTHGLKVHCSTN